MKHAYAALLCLATLSACGTNLKTPKAEAPAYDEQALTTAALSTWGKDFATGCTDRNGQLLEKGELCIYTKLTKSLRNGEGFDADALSSEEIGPINAGDALQVTGFMSNATVDVALDGTLVSEVPSRENRPVTVNKAGTLAFRVRPGGRVSGVKAFVYTCVNRDLRSERCPY